MNKLPKECKLTAEELMGRNLSYRYTFAAKRRQNVYTLRDQINDLDKILEEYGDRVSER